MDSASLRSDATRLPVLYPFISCLKGAGAYSVCVMVDDVEIENSPFLVLADFSSQEALECYVLPEDEWVFERPLQFPLTDGGGQTFCVATEGALRRQQGPNNLTVLCSGPASHSAAVTLSKGLRQGGCGEV